MTAFLAEKNSAQNAQNDCCRTRNLSYIEARLNHVLSSNFTFYILYRFTVILTSPFFSVKFFVRGLCEKYEVTRTLTANWSDSGII